MKSTIKFYMEELYYVMILSIAYFACLYFGFIPHIHWLVDLCVLIFAFIWGDVAISNYEDWKTERYIKKYIRKTAKKLGIDEKDIQYTIVRDKENGVFYIVIENQREEKSDDA